MECGNYDPDTRHGSRHCGGRYLYPGPRSRVGVLRAVARCAPIRGTGDACSGARVSRGRHVLCGLAGCCLFPPPLRARQPPRRAARRQTAGNTPRQSPHTPQTRYRGHPRMGHGPGVHVSCPWSPRERRCRGTPRDISAPCLKGESVRHRSMTTRRFSGLTRKSPAPSSRCRAAPCHG
jgi:hypothetical protein